MAGATVTMSLNDQGTIKKKTDEARQLNKELTKTAALGKAALEPKSAKFVGAEFEERNRGRGAMGQTGASARDFANQAQGLGGLVRLYATYAANIFAVSAAFSALSNAMDTTNMVEGLNQLGAASGVALGSLAKRFAEASGGAISLRESMEATTKAVSSGLSQKQFLQLGEVAKKASQALGVNMSDAVSRLTRGITKLEPELLDELGIFTKVGKATEDYAKSVGKSVTSLTDFERRQAFANAVLEEGMQKFSEIDIPTNPYAKLLASLKDLAQVGLETVNKVLGPLVSALSSSPGALTAVVAALGMTLLKQAIPALGQYRESLQASALASKAVFEERAKAAKAALDKQNELRAKDIKAESDRIAEMKSMRAEEAVQNLKAVAGRKNITPDVRRIISSKQSIIDLTDDDLARVEKLASGNTKLSGTYKELAVSLREARKANLDYIELDRRLAEKQRQPAGMLTTAGIAARQAENARRAAESRAILSGTSELAATEGAVAAFKQLNEQVSSAKLGAVRGTFTRIAGAANIATTAVMGLVSAFQGYILVATLIAGAISWLVDKMSTNVKEGERLKDTIDATTEAVKTSTATFDKYGQSLSVAAVQAKTTAFGNLSDTIADQVIAFTKFEEKANAMSRIKEGFLSIFGADFQSDFAESLKNAVDNGLQNIIDPKLKKSVQGQIAELLGGRDLEKLSTSELLKVARGINKVFSEANQKGQELKGMVDSISQGFKELDSSYTTLANSLINKDPLSNFAVDLIKQSGQLMDSLENPISAAITLQDILKDTSKIRMFPPEAQQGIISAAKEMATLQKAANEAEADLEKASAKLADISGRLARRGQTVAVRQYLGIEETKAKGEVSAATEALRASNDRMNQLTKNLENNFRSAIVQGFELIQMPLSNAIAKASIDANKAALSKLPKSLETIAANASLDKQAIDIQIRQLSATNDLIVALDKARLQEEKSSLERKLAGEDRPGKANELRNQIAIVDKQLQVLSGTKFNKGDLTDREIVAVTPIAQRDVGLRTQIAALEGQKRAISIGEALDAVEQTFKDRAKKLEEQIAEETRARDEFLQSDKYLGLSKSGQMKATAEYDARIASMTAQKGRTALESDLEVASKARGMVTGEKSIAAADAAIKRAQEELALFDKATDKAKALKEIENNRAILKQAGLDKLTLETAEYEKIAQLQQQSDGFAMQNLEVERSRLDILLETGAITSESYAEQLKGLEKLTRQRQLDNKVTDINIKYAATLRAFEKEQIENGGIITQEMQTRKETAEALYNAEIAGVTSLAAKYEDIIALQTKYTEKQKAMGKIIEDSFMGMADALVEFARTGKISFDDLVSDMLAGILKVELQAQMSQIWSAVKPGVMDFIGGLFGAGSGGTSAPVGNYSLSSGFSGPGLKLAKGGAFSGSGLMEFAKGGAFTNSVVSTPTMFKFAQGTGLMGEAGPEAIMPLKRDASGTLGVRAQGTQAKVDVVVNNYGSEKAETTQTVDSRGNRRIEVTIGDMVAGEINRSGSTVNNSLRGAFNAKPALIRR